MMINLLSIPIAGLLAIGTPAVAMAADAQPPVANCGFLSSLVCQVPVTVGPFGPFNFDVNFPQP